MLQAKLLGSSLGAIATIPLTLENTMRFAFVLLITLFAAGCGYGSKYNSQTGGMGAGAAAAISALVPGSATAGGPGFTMTVNGTSFAANSTVYFGGTAQATT